MFGYVLFGYLFCDDVLSIVGLGDCCAYVRLFVWMMLYYVRVVVSCVCYCIFFCVLCYCFDMVLCAVGLCVLARLRFTLCIWYVILRWVYVMCCCCC